MKQITEKQQSVYNFILDYFMVNGYSPSIREIANKFNVTVKTSLDHVIALQKKGYIKRTAIIARSIVILKQSLSE